MVHFPAENTHRASDSPAAYDGKGEGLLQAIHRHAGRAVERWLDERVPGIFNDIMRKEAARSRRLLGPLNTTQFIWQMAFEFMRTDRSMGAIDARDLAIDTLKDFLRDEKIKFGNPAYGWDQSCAVTLARECQTEYWEAA